MAASTTIVRAGDKPHKFSWDLINQSNSSQTPAVEHTEAPATPGKRSFGCYSEPTSPSTTSGPGALRLDYVSGLTSLSVITFNQDLEGLSLLFEQFFGSPPSSFTANYIASSDTK